METKLTIFLTLCPHYAAESRSGANHSLTHQATTEKTDERKTKGEGRLTVDSPIPRNHLFLDGRFSSEEGSFSQLTRS